MIMFFICSLCRQAYMTIAMNYECIISYFFITRQSARLLWNRDYAKGVNNMQLDCVFWLINAKHLQVKKFKPIFLSLKNRQKKSHWKCSAEKSHWKSLTKFTFTKHFYGDFYHRFSHIQTLWVNIGRVAVLVDSKK